jgi:hypothetical protein
MKIFLNSTITYLSLIITIYSCENKKNIDQSNNIYPTSTYYHPDKLIDSISRLFIDSSKCGNCINELYVDKVYDGEAYFTFKARSSFKDYFERNRPSFYFVVGASKIYVYCGIETFSSGNMHNMDTLLSESVSSKPYYLLMAFHLENDSIKLLKVASPPFGPRVEQFVPDKDFPKFNPTSPKVAN